MNDNTSLPTDDTNRALPPRMLDAALSYAHRGWHVFPVHGVVEGRCSCGTLACPNAGKHPRIRHGVHEATTDEAAIRQWWTRWPGYQYWRRLRWQIWPCGAGYRSAA
jgi:Bifunctional DNA primase/polymerase, N-terminal